MDGVFLFEGDLLRTNLRSLHTLLAFLSHEGNSLAFFQAFETETSGVLQEEAEMIRLPVIVTL